MNPALLHTLLPSFLAELWILSVLEHYSPKAHVTLWKHEIRLHFGLSWTVIPLLWNISGRQGAGESWLAKRLRGGEGGCLDAQLGNVAFDSILRLFLLSLKISRKKYNNLNLSLKMCVGLHSVNGATWILGLSKYMLNKTTPSLSNRKFKVGGFMLLDKGQQFLRKRFCQCITVFPAKLVKFSLFLTAVTLQCLKVLFLSCDIPFQGWRNKGWAFDLEG